MPAIIFIIYIKLLLSNRLDNRMYDHHEHIVAREYFQQVPIICEMWLAALSDEEEKKSVESETTH